MTAEQISIHIGLLEYLRSMNQICNQENTNPEKLAYTIFADIGVAPWAWVKSAEDKTRYVGPNCADGSGWFADIKMSEQLERDFVEWAIFYDSQPWFKDESIYQTFDWVSFNKKGIELATRLKSEIGDSALVYYAYPSEEPDRVKVRIEVLNDGTRRPFNPID